MQHLLKKHPSIIIQQYKLQKNQYLNFTFDELLAKLQHSEVTSIGIIDTTAFHHLKSLNTDETDLTFEIIYGKKPSFQNTFFKGGNYKEIMLLLGLIIFTTENLQKKLIIYTSENKNEIISSFCSFHGFENTKVISECEQIKEEHK